MVGLCRWGAKKAAPDPVVVVLSRHAKTSGEDGLLVLLARATNAGRIEGLGKGYGE